jgi:LemA protein
MRFTEKNLCPGDPVVVLCMAESSKDAGDPSGDVVIRQTEGQPLMSVKGSQSDVVWEFGSRILVRIGGGTAGVLLGAGCLAAADFSAQDPTPAFATVEAVVAAAGAFVLVLGIAATIYGGIIYNGLVGLRNEVDREFANIDVLLKQQFDILPNLGRICTAYMQHESSLLRELARARSAWTVAHANGEKWKVGADTHLALKQLFALSEAYPALRANESFVRLQEIFTGIEEQIADRRELYNAAVGRFNARIKQLPDAWIAHFTGFASRPFFAAPADEWAGASTASARSPNW